RSRFGQHDARKLREQAVVKHMISTCLPRTKGEHLNTCDFKRPCEKIAAGTKRVPLAPQHDVRFLQNVFHIRIPADKRGDKRVQARLSLRDQPDQLLGGIGNHVVFGGWHGLRRSSFTRKYSSLRKSHAKSWAVFETPQSQPVPRVAANSISSEPSEDQ